VREEEEEEKGEGRTEISRGREGMTDGSRTDITNKAQ
jgi:hypothetical protein